MKENYIIKVLLNWNYAKEKASVANIAAKVGRSESQVRKWLKYLQQQGKVAKSPGGSWYVTQQYKKFLMEQMKMLKGE